MAKHPEGFPELPKLPKFPVLFSEEDVARKEELEARRTELEKIYLENFAPDVWAAKSPIERGLRTVAAEAFAPSSILRDITPWEETGFTPEQFGEYQRGVEAEYQELQRVELVVGRVSSIREHLTALALQGILNGSLEQLYNIIPELGDSKALPLTNEERKWIEDYALNIAGKSREEVLDVYSQGKELTPEEIMEGINLVLPPIPTRNPAFVLSSVAFSKNLGEVADALKEAYPPQVEEPEQDFESMSANNIRREMAQRDLVPSGNLEADIRTLNKVYEEEDKERGELIVLTDSSTGKTQSAFLKEDSSVWVDNKMIGRYSLDTKQFSPLNEDEWYTMQAIEESEKLTERTKIIMRGFIARGEGANYENIIDVWTKNREIIKSLDPTAADNPWAFFSAGVGDVMVTAGSVFTWMGKDGLGENLSQFGGNLQKLAAPDNLGDFEWSHLWNPRFWATRVPRTMAFTVVLIPAMILGASGGAAIGGAIGLGIVGRTILGAIGASVFSRPLESALEGGSSYDQAIAAGMSHEEASEAAQGVFTKNLALTVTDAAQLAAAFLPMPAKVMGKLISKGYVRTAIVGGKILVIGLTESGEELYQSYVQQIALGEDFEWDAEVNEAMALGGMMGLGLGGGSVIYNRITHRTIDNLSLPQKESYDNMKAQLVEEGMDEDQATKEALEELATTPEGREAIVLATEQVMNEEIIKEIKDPAVVEVVKKEQAKVEALPTKVKKEVKSLSLTIRELNVELGLFSRSLEIQKERLSTQETAKDQIGAKETQEAITGLEKEITGMKVKRDKLSKRLAKLKKTEIPALETPIKLVTESVWNEMSIPARRLAAKAAGVREKEWASFTDEEKVLLGKEAKLKEEKVIETPEIKEEVPGVKPVIKDADIQAAYDNVIKSLPLEISSEIDNVARISLVEDLEGRGGNTVELANRRADIVIEKGENLEATLQHELLHAYLLKHPEKITGEGFFGVENTIRDIEKSIREGTQPQAVEAIATESPAPEQVEAVETGEALSIDNTQASIQAKEMVGFSEAELHAPFPNNISDTLKHIEEHLFEADMSNPLDIAATKAMYTGNIQDYADSLPPDFNANVTEEFKKAKFTDAAQWNLMRMDTYRAFSFIDNGHFGGIARQKILRPTERLHLAQIRKKEQYTSWYVVIEQKYNMNRRQFRSKKGKDLLFRAVSSVKNFEEAIAPIEETLAKPDIQEIVGAYPVETQENIMGYAKELRILFDSVRADTNVVRIKMGKEPIPYLDNYLPWILETNVWGRLFGLHVKPDFLKETAVPPDFLKPSEPFNARALAREGGLANYEKTTDTRRLFIDYLEVMTQDMFFTPIVQNAKAHAAAMRKDTPAVADWVIDWATESYAGVPGAISRALRRVLPPLVRQPLLAVRRNLLRAVFPLNWTWNVFVQTSSMALSSLQHGIKNTIKGSQYLWNPKVQKLVEDNMFSYIIKSRQEGSLIYQDLGATVQKEHSLTRSRLDTVVHYANFLTRVIEQKLTGVSIYAAYNKGKELGFTGRKLLEYASEGGAKTQSMYNTQNVPGILRSAEVGAIVPFQTFAFEVMNSISEITGIRVLRAGAWHTVAIDTKTGKETGATRVRHLFEFMATVWVLNIIGELGINRKPWQLSSALPFSSLMMSGIEPYKVWNQPLPVRYGAEFYRAVEELYVFGSWDSLREWTIRYHMVGGVQISRTLEGIIAVIEGEVKDVAGETLYEIENNPIDWIKAITMGTYQTEGGKEYIDRMEGAEPTTDRYLKDVIKAFGQLGKEIEGEFYLLPDFGRDIDSIIVNWEILQGNLIQKESVEWTGLPDYIILADGSPFPQLAQFRVYSHMLWKEYNTLPSDEKLDYRKANPIVDAVLYFWYKSSTIRTEEAKSIVEWLFKEYGIFDAPFMHPSLLPEIPEELKLVAE